MNADGKREEIRKMYGSDIFRGKSLSSMPDNQIHAIYGQLQHSGKFEEYQALKESYISLFPKAHYTAVRRANQLSFFELKDIIEKVLKEKQEQFEEGYQFTLWDWEKELENQKLQEEYVKEGYLNKIQKGADAYGN